MSEGWLIHPDASTDEQLAQLSDRALVVYWLSLPHADREGLIEGSASYLLRRCVPGRDYTAADVAGAVEEWVSTTNVHGGPKPLCRWYSDPESGKDVIQFLGFKKRQELLLGLRRGWGRESLLPAPPDQLQIDDALGRVVDVAPRARVPAGARAAADADADAGASGIDAFSSSSVSSEQQQQLTNDARAGDVGRLLRLLEENFEQLFHRPARVSQVQARIIGPLLELVGVDDAVELMRRRKQRGASPNSLPFFVPALEELALARRAIDAAAHQANHANHQAKHNAKERAELYVRRCGWELVDRDLRAELETHRLDEPDVVELLELGRELRQQREEAAA